MATQTYKVNAGDSLSAIAKRYGVKISDITGYKSGDPNRIQTGENLTINIGGLSPSNSKSNAGVITSDQMERANSLPEPTNFVSTSQTARLSDKVSAVASTVFNSNQKAIDDLRKQMQDDTSDRIKEEEKNNKNLRKQVEGQINSTASRDAFEEVSKKLKIEQNIELYSKIQNKIVAAQEALNMGLIYEGSRPARMRLIQGRSASLQKQGLATIGALQGTAEVIRGNINLAMSYAQSTIDAINDDNTRSLSALQTLLNLSNSNLVDLKSEEREIVETRIQEINNEADRIQANKDDVLDLMVQYPRAFEAGGVTLLDTKEEALRKMLPTMADDERRKLAAAEAKAGQSGKSEAEVQSAKQLMLEYKSKGMTYDEAITRFADILTPEYIGQIFGRKPVGTPVDSGDLYGAFLNPDGTPKPGYSVGLDKDGKPMIQAAQPQSTGGGFWKNIGEAISSFWK